MAAPLGFKDFTTGEVLTAADVDGYLMQGIWVFASAAARDAAVTSPQEGNFAYLKDTNVTTYYTGSAWANLDTTGMTNPMTTTGDTIYSSSGSTPARLGIGSTGQVLTVAGGVPSWATPSGGGSSWSLLNTGGTALTGASTITVSGISGVDKIQVIVEGASATGANFELKARFNTNTASVYRRGGGYIVSSATASALVNNTYGLDDAFTMGQSCVSRADANVSGGIQITGANSSGFKQYNWVGSGVGFGGNTGAAMYVAQGIFESTATISSVSIISNNGNFDAGTIYVFTSAS